MTFFAEERAVSPVLGGILMFGLAASLLILTQVSVVPAANQQVEFEHNLGVQADFERFQGSATRVAASGAPETVDVELGTRYPNRFFLVNPAPATGRLSTEDATVTIANVNATNPETDEYFVSVGNTLAYDTKRLVYEPNYRQYGNAPRTVYENGRIYNQYEGDVTLLTSATPIVSDGDITLILIDGDIDDQATDSVSLALQAASAPSQRIAITNTGTDRITITLDTRLPESEWEAFNASSSDVTHVEYDGDAVTITLDSTRDYTLRAARLTVGDDADPRSAAYTTSVAAPASAAPANSSVTYTVEVRDRYNNPVSGVTVVGNASSGAQFVTASGLSQTVTSLKTDEDGRVTVGVRGNDNYEGPVTTHIGVPTIGLDTIDTTARQTYVAYDLDLVPTAVTNVDQVSNVGNSINPGQDSGAVVLGDTGTSGNNVTMTFNNSGVGTAVKDVRLNYYFSAKSQAADKPAVGELYEDGTYVTDLDIGGRWADLNVTEYVTVAAGAEQSFTVSLFKDAGKGSAYTPSASADDFFIITLEFSDESTRVYFVPVAR